MKKSWQKPRPTWEQDTEDSKEGNFAFVDKICKFKAEKRNLFKMLTKLV